MKLTLVASFIIGNTAGTEDQTYLKRKLDLQQHLARGRPERRATPHSATSPAPGPRCRPRQRSGGDPLIGIDAPSGRMTLVEFPAFTVDRKSTRLNSSHLV